MIKLAREAGFPVDEHGYNTKRIERFAALVAAHEREKQIDGDVCASCGGIVYDAVIKQTNEKPVTFPANGLRQQEPSRLTPTGSQSDAIIAQAERQTFDALNDIVAIGRKLYEKSNIEAAVLAERDACAKVCEPVEGSAYEVGVYKTMQTLAAAVRARSEQ